MQILITDLDVSHDFKSRNTHDSHFYQIYFFSVPPNPNTRHENVTDFNQIKLTLKMKGEWEVKYTTHWGKKLFTPSPPRPPTPSCNPVPRSSVSLTWLLTKRFTHWQNIDFFEEFKIDVHLLRGVGKTHQCDWLTQYTVHASCVTDSNSWVFHKFNLID